MEYLMRLVVCLYITRSWILCIEDARIHAAAVANSVRFQEIGDCLSP